MSIRSGEKCGRTKCEKCGELQKNDVEDVK